MRKRFKIIWLFIGLPFFIWGQNPLAGAGNCLSLDGTDDYINVLQTASINYNLPVTITAWINVNTTATGVQPIFSSNDQSGVNAGIHFWLTDTTLNAGYSNGLTGNFYQQTRIKQFSIDTLKGVWMHVAAVVTANNIDLYLNGIQVGGQYLNNSISFSQSTLGTTVIGRKTNGNTTNYFDGKMDEVMIWKGALTPVDVRNNMCVKMIVPPTNVHRYFRLDQVNGNNITDRSLNNVSAQLVNGPTLQASGAALGDAASYVYQSGSWGGYVHTFSTGNNNIFKVKNVLGDPDGLQMYWVESMPNTFDTLDWICAEQGYIGVFICKQNLQNYNYNFEYNFNNNTAVNNYIPVFSNISLKRRKDNTATWATVVASAPATKKFTLTGEITRKEYAISGVHVPPIFDIPDTISCLDSIALSVPYNPVYNYLWSNGNTTNQTVIKQSGSYWVSYGDSCNTFTVVDSFSVTIGFNSVDIGSDTTLCIGDSILLSTGVLAANHLWQDGSTQPTLWVTKPGMYWVSLSFGPCVGGDTILVNYENVVPFSLGNDTSFCFGDSILLDATLANASKYLWNTGDTTAQIWATVSGNYSVQAGSGGCFENDDINISVDLDDVLIAPDTLICTHQSANLWASGAEKYLWSTGDTVPSFTVQPTQTTTYTVFVYEGACVDSFDITVTVANNIATANFEFTVDACTGSVQFTNLSSNADSYIWNFGDGQNSTDKNPTHVYARGGWVTVTLVASKNSCPDTLSQTVQVINLKDIIYFPTAFSPNADGLNDSFEVKGSESCFINPKLVILNRWGQEIFNTTQPFTEFWDGTFNGKQAPQGAYFYTFTSVGFNKRGVFTVVN